MLDRATGSERGRLQKAGRALHNLSDKPSREQGDTVALAKNPGRKAKKQTNRRTCRESVAHREPKRDRAAHQPQGLIQQVAAILPCRLADVAQPARDGALARGFDARTRRGGEQPARARSPMCRFRFRFGKPACDGAVWKTFDVRGTMSGIGYRVSGVLRRRRRRTPRFGLAQDFLAGPALPRTLNGERRDDQSNPPLRRRTAFRQPAGRPTDRASRVAPIIRPPADTHANPHARRRKSPTCEPHESAPATTPSIST